MIWSIQQHCYNKQMKSYLSTWKTFLYLSHSLDARGTLFVTNIYFSLRRESSRWADSFERFRARDRSLSSAWVKGIGWLFSSGLYASFPTTTVMSLCSVSELYSTLPFSSGTGRSGSLGTDLIAEGKLGYWTWCLFRRFIPFRFIM